MCNYVCVHMDARLAHKNHFLIVMADVTPTIYVWKIFVEFFFRHQAFSHMKHYVKIGFNLIAPEQEKHFKENTKRNYVHELKKCGLGKS